jgi:hypothetical protein
VVVKGGVVVVDVGDWPGRTSAPAGVGRVPASGTEPGTPGWPAAGSAIAGRGLNRAATAAAAAAEYAAGRHQACPERARRCACCAVGMSSPSGTGEGPSLLVPLQTYPKSDIAVD